MIKVCLSSLPHTWIIDIDGTILKHNGHKQGGDLLLDGVKEFWEKIPRDDFIILISARERFYVESTILFLRENCIRYDQIIFGVPIGERILVNDIKPSGLPTAHAVNVQRDKGLCFLSFSTDEQ
jgi:hypothetical protein